MNFQEFLKENDDSRETYFDHLYSNALNDLEKEKTMEEIQKMTEDEFHDFFLSRIKDVDLAEKAADKAAQKLKLFTYK
jgi:hypothetical protein